MVMIWRVQSEVERLCGIARSRIVLRDCYEIVEDRRNLPD